MISGSIADGENLAFTIPNDGKRYFPEIRIFDPDDNALYLQKYSEWQEAWENTGDSFTVTGTYTGELAAGGNYRLMCSGTGTSVVEIEVV
jgi:hypothetical protein